MGGTGMLAIDDGGVKSMDSTGRPMVRKEPIVRRERALVEDL
jgi:hypothetical protein